jgi:hypothetical protein
MVGPFFDCGANNISKDDSSADLAPLSHWMIQ